MFVLLLKALHSPDALEVTEATSGLSSPIRLDALPIVRKCFQHSSDKCTLNNWPPNFLSMNIGEGWGRRGSYTELSLLFLRHSFLFTYFVVCWVSIYAIINYLNLSVFHWAKSRCQKVAFISGDSRDVFLLIHVVSRIELLVTV